MKETKKHYEMKPLEDMNVIDNFLFTEIMSAEEDGAEACRIILGSILRREIGEITFTPQRAVPGVSEDNHGIILDTYIKESRRSGGVNAPDINVFDIEPDNKSQEKKWLPRRSRYYGDLIDVQLLETGVNYDRLPDLVTIFILSYDPFGKNEMCYEAGSIIKTHPELPYNDGIRRIYLYVNGELSEAAGDDERKLQNLLRYINDSKGANVIDETTKRLDDIVKRTKAKKDVGVRYMKSWEREREIREEVRKENQAEIEAERQRADQAEQKASQAEQRASQAEQKASQAEQKASQAERKASQAEQKAKDSEAMLAKYREKYGDAL